MPYLDIDGIKYYYSGKRVQKGLPVIFCHGSGGGHHHWSLQYRNLPETIDTLALDLPGHGRSAGEPLHSVAAYRDWLYRFVNAAGLGPVVIAGHSLGGAIALDFALHYPAAAAALILIGTGGRLRVLPAILKSLQEGNLPPELYELPYGPQAPALLLKRGRLEINKTNAFPFYADLRACDQFDIMNRLPEIDRPALIICGSEDRMTPVKYSLHLQKELPQAKLVIIEGAGHMVMLEKSEEVNAAISAFCTEIIAGGS